MKNFFESLGSFDPFGMLSEKLENFLDTLKIYIIIGLIAIVLISLLFDLVRKYIRGLDMAAIGGLLLWIGFKIKEVPIIKGLCGALSLAGRTLLIAGLVVFAVIRLAHYLKRRRMRQKLLSAPQDPLRMLEGLRDCGVLTQAEFTAKKREFSL